MIPSRLQEKAAAEMIGALALVAIFAVVIAIVAVNQFSASQQPETIPSVRSAVTNSSTNITISHIGGDSIPLNQLGILVDGVPTAFSCTDCNDSWAIGESIDLHVNSPQMPNKVDIIYKGIQRQQLLETQYLGLQTPTYTPGPIPVTTTPAPPLTVFHTITVTQGSNGNIIPGSSQVADGSSVTFTILPDNWGINYHIADLTVDGVSQGSISSYTFTNVRNDHTISATFAITLFTISTSTSAGGHIQEEPLGTAAPSIIPVNSGEDRTFTILTDPGYYLVDTLVDGVSMGANKTSYTFIDVQADHTLEALFNIISYKITPTAGPGGSITPSDIQTVPFMGGRAFMITPDTGYHITDVSVDEISQGSLTNYTFTNVTADHIINASFAINPYTVTPTAGSGGSITPSAVQTVNYGDNLQFMITPDTDYRVADVLVNGTSVGAVTSYLFTNITTNQTIAATFAINTYTITTTAGPNGAIAPAGVTPVNYGGSQAYTITPNTGYHVADVLVNGTSVGAVTSYLFTNITTNQTIAVTFATNTYTITTTAGPNGAIAPAGVTPVNYGGSQAYTITPNTGYHVADVLMNGTSVGAVTGYTFTNVQTNQTIVATFAINTYTITATAGTGGTIIPSGTIIVTYGGSQAYTIAPNSGYNISMVTVDGTSQGGVTSYSFTNVTVNHTIAAAFIMMPVVTGIFPAAGPIAGGTSVAITGTGFTGANGVKYGSTAAASYTVNSATSITATSPAGTGTVNITVTTPGGISATSSADQFTYYALPVITSISPAAGPIAGGTSVTITGTGFTGANGVKFGSTAAASYTVNSAISITATSPAGSAGIVDILVTTPGGTSATSSADQFTYYVIPAVTSISPAVGPIAGGTSVTITGTGFTGANGVKFGSTAAASYTVNSATSITATSPAGTGTVDITVTTPGGTSATSSADQFTYYVIPAVTGISPTTGTSAGGTSVAITGTGFSGATGVKFGTTAATSYTVNSAISITATSPVGSAGIVNITVTTPGGTSAIVTGDKYDYYTIQSFTTVGTTSWIVPSGVTKVDYLVVAGGGGGGGTSAWGNGGGGGGAGGFLTATGFAVTAGNSYTVTVGAGGAGGAAGANSGTKGGNSVFATITATGGGYGAGGSGNTAGGAGGSGGGGILTGNGGAGTSGQGYAGGKGLSSSYLCGGGGGASATGGAATATAAGAGGAGTASSISGSSVTYAGGGGGGSGQIYSGAAGGSGGGGAGGALNANPGADATGYGSGGGGGTSALSGQPAEAGGKGSNGIVIIKYY